MLFILEVVPFLVLVVVSFELDGRTAG